MELNCASDLTPRLTDTHSVPLFFVAYFRREIEKLSRLPDKSDCAIIGEDCPCQYFEFVKFRKIVMISESLLSKSGREGLMKKGSLYHYQGQQSCLASKMLFWPGQEKLKFKVS